MMDFTLEGHSTAGVRVTRSGQLLAAFRRTLAPADNRFAIFDARGQWRATVDCEFLALRLALDLAGVPSSSPVPCAFEPSPARSYVPVQPSSISAPHSILPRRFWNLPRNNG